MKKSWRLPSFVALWLSLATPTAFAIHEDDAPLLRGPAICHIVLQPRYAKIMESIRDFSRDHHAVWPSAFLKSIPLDTTQAAKALLKRLLTDPAIPTEAARFIQESTAPGSRSDIWDLYFRAYDQTVLYSWGFAELYAAAAHYIPAKARSFADIGGGSGNFSALMAGLHPDIEVQYYDSSPAGKALAEKKVARIRGSASSRDVFTLLDLTGKLPEAHFDSAVINNVLYNFKLPQKRALLKWGFDSLPEEGILMLGDIRPEVQSSPTAQLGFFERVLESTLNNASPINEFDLALILYINRLVIQSSPEFTDAKALCELATEAGFRVIAQGVSYQNGSNVLILQKPARP